MTKAAAMNLLGVVRAFALAMTLTGLIILLASVAVQSAWVAYGAFVHLLVLSAAFGAAGVVCGILLAFTCSLARLFVARMKFLT